MICDKLCLLWKEKQGLTTADANVEVLGHRLPVALTDQDGVHPPVKVSPCCNTNGNERTTRGSHHLKRLELQAVLPTESAQLSGGNGTYAPELHVQYLQ